MTKALKPVTRETFSSVRERGKLRPLVITVASTYVSIRLKGQRKSFQVTMDQLYTLGARNAAEAKRRERAEAKKAKGVSRG